MIRGHPPSSAGAYRMKTLFQLICFVVLALALQTSLFAKDTKSSKDTKSKSATAQNKETPKVADDGQKSAKPEDNKPKDPLENMKFRNLGPAVGGGRVTS